MIDRRTAEAIKQGAKRPRVVSLNPPNGARDVDPAIAELRVTFDMPMGGGFSWTGGGPEFPRPRAGPIGRPTARPACCRSS